MVGKPAVGQKDTKILLLDDSDAVLTAGEMLKAGKIVIIPTETVYGLAANGLDPQAVKEIFTAKGRPQDNPLIVHIASVNELDMVAKNIPESAYVLAKSFMPGPLTIVLEKKDIVPNVTSGGLDTVAVRVPSSDMARNIIKAAGVPLAAPSANISGRPSPTSFEHCKQDMIGRVDGIVQGENCCVGVESTVISLVSNPPKLLRPGGVTLEQLCEVLGEVEVDSGVVNKLSAEQIVASPGMKYQHYCPSAEIFLVSGSSQKFGEFLNEKNGFGVCFTEDIPYICGEYLCYGHMEDYKTQAVNLFDMLLKLDDLAVKTAYIHAPKQEGMGLAVYNRLVRSAGFKIIEL